MTTMINRPTSALPERLPSAEPALFEQTVPRHLVHRAAVSEVFLTDLRVIHESMFQVGAQWPRAHSFFGPKSGLHDPLLLAETMRQATLAIAHRVYDVALDANFVLQELTFSVTEPGLRVDRRPVDVVLTAVAHDVKRRGKVLAGMRLEFTVYRDTKWVGSGEILFRCVSAASYARLRGEHHGRQDVPAALPAPACPAQVGRNGVGDVVLGQTPVDNIWLLRVDLGHPVLFDHEVDHVPGVVAMEAARQAAFAVVGREMVAVYGKFIFLRYIEFDTPCTVEAKPDTSARADFASVEVTLEQSGHTAATATLKLLVR